ncbi:unnamed protein product [Clonostachys byssicola]|uniref:Uncharacterized protein n=1 Tax=Clonostachys byssicola TaxID=160290 RepID=A0A9N9XU02_9HYPO|nr:unnamed protein product [Clonostachys byssicola]
MASEATDSQPLDTIRFRPSKKRKVYRSRADDEDDESDRRAAQIPSASANEPRAVASDFFGRDDSEETTPQASSSVAAALRHRSARRGRLQGVGFSTRSHHATTTDPAPSDERALVPRHGDDDEAPAQIGMANRFTQQTGLVSDIDDKHIRAAERAPPAPNNHPPQDGDDTADDPSRSSSAHQAPGQPVMQGKLVEVDLASHPIPATGDDKSGGRESKRQRLGRDGKPWRPRKRRGSDDIKRDKLVEEFLSENRRECPSSAHYARIDLFTDMTPFLLVGVYDVPEVSAPSPAADGEADERLAEEFRRQFLDDVARRRQQQQQRKKKPTQAAKPGSEDVLRGPKLGGSRNQRAAVRDILLKKEKEAKK